MSTPASSPTTNGSTNSSVTPRLVRLPHRVARGRRRALPTPLTISVPRPLGALPAVVAIHRPVAADDACRCARGSRRSSPRCRQLRRATHVARDASGATSRPSVIACTRHLAHAAARAAATSATRCSRCECTPPTEPSPTRCRTPRPAARASQASDERAGVVERAVGDRLVDAREVLVARRGRRRG